MHVTSYIVCLRVLLHCLCSNVHSSSFLLFAAQGSQIKAKKYIYTYMHSKNGSYPQKCVCWATRKSRHHSKVFLLLQLSTRKNASFYYTSIFFFFNLGFWTSTCAQSQSTSATSASQMRTHEPNIFKTWHVWRQYRVLPQALGAFGMFVVNRRKRLILTACQKAIYVSFVQFEGGTMFLFVCLFFLISTYFTWKHCSFHLNWWGHFSYIKDQTRFYSDIMKIIIVNGRMPLSYCKWFWEFSNRWKLFLWWLIMSDLASIHFPNRWSYWPKMTEVGGHSLVMTFFFLSEKKIK